jgi:hypothetical protein
VSGVQSLSEATVASPDVESDESELPQAATTNAAPSMQRSSRTLRMRDWDTKTSGGTSS